MTFGKPDPKKSAAALASAAALLFASAPLTLAHAADEAPVKCDGGNACKGKSECSTATNACAGQNACKGKGYVMLPKAECAKAQTENRKT